MAVVKLGFKVFPPLLGRGAGRPKVQRYRGCLEKNASKKVVKRKRCGDFGHFEKTCKLAEIGEDGERTPPRNKACFYPLYGSFIWTMLFAIPQLRNYGDMLPKFWQITCWYCKMTSSYHWLHVILQLQQLDNHNNFMHDIPQNTVTYEYNRIAWTQ